MRGQDIVDLAIGRATDDRVSTLLLGAAFDPIQRFAVDGHVAKSNGSLNQHLGRDR